MRRLAGSLLYLIFAFVFVYCSIWVFFSHSASAQSPVLTGNVLGKKTFAIRVRTKSSAFIASNTPTVSPSPTLTPTPTPKPTLTPSPTLTPTPKPSNTPTPTTQAPAQNTAGSGSNSLLDAVNAYRVSLGLSKVQSNNETCAFAQTRAGEIVSGFNHDGFTNRINSHTLPYSSYSEVTENIAETSDASQVVTMWINSPGHAANMQKDTPFVCIAQSGNYFAYEGWKP